MYELIGHGLRVHFKALKSALIDTDTSGILKRQNDALNGALEDVLALRILSAIEENPKMSQNEMADRFNVARRSVQRKIEELKSFGKIERIGGKRYGYWKINN